MDPEHFTIKHQDQNFDLHGSKIAFWREEKAILVSDLHAGKASHFRRYGLPLSTDHLLRDLISLETSIKRLNAEQLFILGDLFHSDHNAENQFVVNWLNQLPIPYLLVEGNHDRHSIKSYEINRTEVFEKAGILLSHDLMENPGLFNIAGHLHPAYTIKGKARQRLRMACFWASDQHLILPAFGSLTGSMTVKPGKNDTLVLVDGQQAIPLTFS
ncbi:ligase-associated DNA damage response endonuclease PdeM [bacterium]|nr:ligase-associated DNA damage response endonuclease PdeM [bacterium]